MCDHCPMLPRDVTKILKMRDRHFFKNYKRYQDAMRRSFCPLMRGIERLCPSCLYNAATRLLGDDRDQVGLWVWLLRDEAGKAQDLAQAQYVDPDNQRGLGLEGLAQALFG